MALKIVDPQDKKKKSKREQITFDSVCIDSIQLDKMYISEHSWFVQSRELEEKDEERIIVSVLEFPIDPFNVHGVDICGVPREFEMNKILNGDQTLEYFSHLLAKDLSLSLDIDTLRRSTKRLILHEIQDED